MGQDQSSTSVTAYSQDALTQLESLEDLYNLNKSGLDAVEKQALALLVQVEDSPDSFSAFYKLISGTDLPVHIYKWVEKLYIDHHEDRGTIHFAFRGSWKTTSLTVMFTAYRIGKDPERANLIIQANDDSAIKSASSIARIIEYHEGWKLSFPNIIPDKARGWSQAGYEVKRSDVDYAEWVAQNASRKDPTLFGCGITSSSLIGRHPDGVLVLDDIHDELNTASNLERAKIRQLVTDTILPMVVEDETRLPGNRLVTWEMIVGTPWNENDAYYYLKSTGEFGFMSTPVMNVAAPDNPDAVTFEDFQDLLGWWTLTWPERFSHRIVTSWRRKTGTRGFARMYILDPRRASETGLKYVLYPHEEIDPRWPAGGGVDYASTITIRGKTLEITDRSKFAISHGQKLPTGGAVIVDGVVGHVSQLQAESYVERAQGLFSIWLTTGVEMNGKGEEFYSILSRKPMIRLLPFWTGSESKTNRHERQLGPWMENGTIKISDADTPFLNELRKALDDWPYGNLDVIDSVYAYAKTIPDVLVMPDPGDGLPAYGRPRQKKKHINPFIALGSKGLNND